VPLSAASVGQSCGGSLMARWLSAPVGCIRRATTPQAYWLRRSGLFVSISLSAFVCFSGRLRMVASEPGCGWPTLFS
jgi:hypothetical protein